MFTLNHDLVLLGVLVANAESVMGAFLTAFAAPPVIQGRLIQPCTRQVENTAVGAI
jgi:hypothetical protein